MKIHAAPKNPAYNSQVKAYIIGSGPGSGNARLCGYYAVVEIRRSGNPIGRVTFSHLAAQASVKEIPRWGGSVGKIAKLPYNSGANCYQVSNSTGIHSHIEFRSYGPRPACAHKWGAISIPAGKYQGYIGDYGRAPLARNVCPNGI